MWLPCIVLECCKLRCAAQKHSKNLVVAPYLSFRHQLLNSPPRNDENRSAEGVDMILETRGSCYTVQVKTVTSQGFKFSISETRNTTVNSPGGDLGCPKISPSCCWSWEMRVHFDVSRQWDETLPVQKLIKKIPAHFAGLVVDLLLLAIHFEHIFCSPASCNLNFRGKEIRTFCSTNT